MHFGAYDFTCAIEVNSILIPAGAAYTLTLAELQNLNL